MSRSDKFGSGKLAGKSFASEIDDPIVADPDVSGALKHFKSSVDAWSEAAYSRPKFNDGADSAAHLASGGKLDSGMFADRGKSCRGTVRASSTAGGGACGRDEGSAAESALGC